LSAAACGGLRSAPDHRTRRALLHLSYSCAPQITHTALVTHDPERTCAAAEALAAIQRLFASDDAATKVITGMISGMGAEEIRCHYDMTAVEYDTTRRRIRRTLLRHGLAWSWP